MLRIYLTKKKTVKKTGLTAVRLFGRMLEEAHSFDYMAYGHEENPWDQEFFEGGLLSDSVRIEGNKVTVYDILTCPKDQPVVVKGDTAEIKFAGTGYTYLFRFYVEPKRVENLKEMVK